MLKYIFSLSIILGLGSISAQTRPRIIILSDISGKAELDDTQSFIRFLLYSNEFDIKGILGTGSKYEPSRGDKAMYEGDTPSFLHLYPNGLSDPEKVHYGGWGGRYNKDKVRNANQFSHTKIDESEFYNFLITTMKQINGVLKARNTARCIALFFDGGKNTKRAFEIPKGQVERAIRVYGAYNGKTIDRFRFDLPKGEGTTQNANMDFESRKQLLLDSIANWANTLDLESFKKSDEFDGGKYGAYPTMALFEKGHIEKARQFAAQQLVGGAAMFRDYTTMALYMQYHELYGQALRDKVKQDQIKSNFFNFSATDSSVDVSQSHRNNKLGGASENHKLMYASAAYLAGIAWPDDYPKEWYQMGYEHLMNWFDIVTNIGFWEEDSPTYLIHHMGPILTVAEYAPEGSEMKKRASMVLDWYFLSIAGEYLKGYWITPAARDYNPMYGLTNSAETTALTWLYFGDAAFVPHPHVRNKPFRHWEATLHFALSNYKMPDIIKRIATDRDQAFVHREFMKKNPMHPKQYCYITPSYGMASIVGENGKIVPDATRWKVQWVVESKEEEPSVFFLKHPYGDNNWTAWRGASPAEQVLQYQDALIAVYKMEDEDKDFIDGPFSDSSFKVIVQKKDWLFLHAGNCLIAAYAANGFSISEEERLGDSHGFEITYKSLKSTGRKNGLIVQTAAVESYISNSPEAELKLFMQDILAKTQIDTSAIDADQPRLKYKSLSGNWLEIEFDNFKKIDGKLLDLENWPLLENPWMHQDIGGNLILKHNNEERIYDFANWTVK